MTVRSEVFLQVAKELKVVSKTASLKSEESIPGHCLDLTRLELSVTVQRENIRRGGNRAIIANCNPIVFVIFVKLRYLEKSDGDRTETRIANLTFELKKSQIFGKG